MKKLSNQSGIIKILPVLIIVASVGIISFLLISSTLPFNGGFFSFLFQKPFSHAAISTDVTSNLENLGSPFSTRFGAVPYARNVWDMQRFTVNGVDRIYIGAGNESNNVPPINAGSTVPPGGGVEVYYFDTSLNKFVQDVDSAGNPAKVRTEQIDLFKVLPFNNGAENDLVIPDTDDIGSGEYFFRRSPSTGWVSTLIDGSAVHNRSIGRSPDGTFWASMVGASSSVLGTSGDGTGSWNSASCPAESCAFGLAFEFFNLGGQMFVNWIGWSNGSNLGMYTGTPFQFSGVSMPQAEAMFPNLSINGSTNLCATPGFIANNCPLTSVLVVRPVNFGAYTFYMAANFYPSGPEYEWDPYPQAIYKSQAIGSATQLIFPGEDPNFIPRDIVTSGSKVYVLGSYVSGANTINVVYSSIDTNTWTEVLKFTSAVDNYAKSFEYAGGYFYFGMGSEYNSVSNNTGTIYRVADPLTFSPAPSSTSNCPKASLGDIDCDGQIGIFDYNILLSNFNQSGVGIPGDIDKDGKVGIFDYNILISNFKH